MKMKLMILLSAVIMLAAGSLGGSAKVDAAIDYTNTELKITAVPDIGADFPATLNELDINNTTMIHPMVLIYIKSPWEMMAMYHWHWLRAELQKPR